MTSVLIDKQIGLLSIYWHWPSFDLLALAFWPCRGFNSLSTRPSASLRGAGAFGDYDCDAPVKLIEAAVEFIRDFTPDDGGDVNFVLWTG